MGFALEHRFGGSGFVEEVVVRVDDNTSPSFNVLVNGNTLFSNDQVLAAADTPETFVPDQNRHYSGPSVEVLFSVTGSASVANQINATVLVDDGKGS